MREKRLLKCLFAFLLCVLLVLPIAAMPALAADGENSGDTLIVGVPVDRCPVFYQDPDTKEITGIGVNLMQAAARAAGYNTAFHIIEEPTLKEALDNPAYDLVMPFGSALDSAAGKRSIVSDNLIQTPFTLVTVGRHSLPPLDELRVGMLKSLAAGAESVNQMFPGMVIRLYDTMSECVKALRTGEVDALLHNSYVWSYVLQKPAYHDLTMQPAAMFSMDFRAAAPDTPEGRAMIDRLNGGIASIPDTKRQAIILDHTSRKLYQYDVSDYLYQFGLFITLTLLLVIALIIIAVQKNRAVREEHEKRLQQILDHDPLTGALSMNGFRKRVMELLQQHPDAPYFLSYNNIRDFKFINDSLGREAGDALLRFWVAKSKENLSDDEAIGRIDADHLAVLRHISGEQRMRDDEEKVFAPVHNFFINQGIDNRVQICSGIYILTPKDFREIDVDHMLDLARVAEKRIRESRKGNFAFYNPEQWEKGKRLAEIVNYLPSAIKSGDIQVWYQPQVDYDKGLITGAEALCRWDHTKLGWLYPFDFISTLEEAGLIFDLDSFVWDRVCRDLKRWKDEGKLKTVSVNVSRDDIREDRDIPGHFQKLIQRYGLSPDQLRIEITETAYAESPELLISTTEKLRAMGFQVEMDDFGSGYSSLHMLKEVPVDRIKLDLHFLTASGDPEKSSIIVSCIIQMVHQMGMKMIAEGVENVTQAKFLQSKGCAEMQGYYFYKPMPVQEFEKLSQTIDPDK